ncbi:MAG: hypothetical protein JXR37_02075 [Kiritimatiellae bacterium]|nr:hypothetical protein [Kiritimatiellia bacterium]
MSSTPFAVDVTPDWEGLVKCIRREGTPPRVFHIELFLDGEVQGEICRRYDVLNGTKRDTPDYGWRRVTAVQEFVGYDFVRSRVGGLELKKNNLTTSDTAALARQRGRSFTDEHRGPITNWEEFEKYPWPDLANANTRELEWLQENLPEGMCIVGSGLASFAEWMCWLMGYETLCYALYDQRDLVKAITDRLVEIDRRKLELELQFDRVKIIWGHDDMGFKNGTLVSPGDLREFVLPGHKLMAKMAHDAGRPYILHSCGNLHEIMDDLIDDVQIDGKHSFEDTIECVIADKAEYGDRLSLLGGIDVDFLCRSSEEQIRKRVRETLDKCQPGGGYCLGSGNSVANYIPVDNFLAMVDEGRKYGRG